MNRALLAPALLFATLTVAACDSGEDEPYTPVYFVTPAPPATTSNPGTNQSIPSSTQPPPVAANGGSAFIASPTATATAAADDTDAGN